MSTFRVLCLASALGFAACGGGGDSSVNQATDSTDDANAGPACQAGKPDPRACDPADTFKTTVCHIPPGNPANEHTICVGNPAVPAHLAHGDFLGSCCGQPAHDGGTAGGTDGGILASGPII
ncbi:MAG TPA: hypothetical protein VHB97_18800 [Polyangia bacterium]|jgi:hypothetical protein|nr:hypothetical protein [Polyangia bacterium]